MWDEVRNCRSLSTSESAESRNVPLAALTYYCIHVNFQIFYFIFYFLTNY